MRQLSLWDHDSVRSLKLTFTLLDNPILALIGASKTQVLTSVKSQPCSNQWSLYSSGVPNYVPFRKWQTCFM